MAVTIKDVARLADVSIKTVSRVVNNEPHVSEEVRKRVQAAIRNSGYAPNLSARRLVQQRSYSIGILLYPGFDQPASALLSTLLDLSYAENYEVIFQSYFPTLSHSRNLLVERINQRRCDGYVITPPCDTDAFLSDILNTYKIPFVQINPLDHAQQYPFVAADDYQSGYTMTEHLISLGHRRISFLQGPRNMRSSLDRLHGFQDALAAHQIPLRQQYLRDSEFTFDGGLVAAKELLALPEPPTAIFAGNDTAAFGALFAARERGLRVPEDLSIAGHDDLPDAKYIYPGLTTIRQPADQLIEQAARLLIQILANAGPDTVQVKMDSQLVIRGSTSTPAR